MNWIDYFDIEIVKVDVCPNIKGWKYYHFSIKSTMPFKNKDLKTDVVLLNGHSCNLIVQILPLDKDHIAPHQCWYGESMPSKEYIVSWLHGMIRGEIDVSYMCHTYFQFINYYVYMTRTFHAVKQYLGNELFLKFYYHKVA